MAALIEAASSITVGKKRNITDIGMVICCGRWSRSIAATNSLTVVVVTTKYPMTTLGVNLSRMPTMATAM